MLNQEAIDRKYFISEEFEWWAYKQMITDQKIYDKEISAYLVIKKGTNQMGVLIQPWAKNKRDEADPYIGAKFYPQAVIVDHKGIEYTPLLWIHTHPGMDVFPSGRLGDQAALATLRRLGFSDLKAGVLTETNYTGYDTKLKNDQYIPAMNNDLLNGEFSLFSQFKR